MALKLAFAINSCPIHLGAQLQIELWPINIQVEVSRKKANQKPARSQLEAGKKPARSLPEVSQKPARSQPVASQLPASQPDKKVGNLLCVHPAKFLTIQVTIQRKENPV